MSVELEDLFPEDMKYENERAKIAIKEETPVTDEFAASKWMKASEVAEFFGVDPKTVTKWAQTGKLDKIKFFRTPGGHRRYNREDIEKLVEANGN